MRHIDLDNFFPTQAWLDDATERTAHINGSAPADRSTYLNTSENKIWNEDGFANSLKDLGHRKCWYAEVKSEVNLYIDHFRPKLQVTRVTGSYTYPEGGTRPNADGYYWKAYDYNNFRVANDKSNKRKGGYFPLQSGTNSCDIHTGNEAIEDNNVMLLDPCVANDVSLLLYSYNNPKPVFDEVVNAHNYHRAAISIMAYDLEHSLLDRLRRRLLQKCHNYIIEAEKYYQASDFSKFDRPVSFLVEMLNPESEFTMMIHHRLKGSAEEWIEPFVIDVARELNYLE